MVFKETEYMNLGTLARCYDSSPKIIREMVGRLLREGYEIKVLEWATNLNGGVSPKIKVNVKDFRAALLAECRTRVVNGY